MNRKFKTAAILLSLSTLAACGSDDDNKKYSDDYITTPADPVVTEPNDDTSDPDDDIITPDPDDDIITPDPDDDTSDPDDDTTTPDPDDDEAEPVEGDDLVINGGFEDWTTIDSVATPDSWTTIDSGITMTANNTLYQTGETSAEINVTTATQASTDLRQSVEVIEGTTYLFSSAIYHTEGGIKARLYIGDYLDYSEYNLVNQWQELTYTYTATATGSLEIGLRFYDDSSVFDGEEIVYVDSISFTEYTVTEETPEDDTPVLEDAITGNLLANADFENWSDAVLDSWTSETGTTIVANTEVFNRSLTSAEVSVNTATQGDTDFRQSVDVTDGFTYTYSTWIYHTDGGASVTLYIDGTYATSSDSTLLGQWQEVSYEYTAEEDKTIEVGVRFYDVADLFDGAETVYMDNFSLLAIASDSSDYYDLAANETGLELKTALFNIISDHTNMGYDALWDFISANSLDVYNENDNTIFDMYSENPTGIDSYNFTAVTNQCASGNGEEGFCYNREHSFPKSWFGGSESTAMYSDVHHIYAADYYVNNKRSNYPYGEVDTASWTSENGSKLGTASDTLGYSGTVFEPIDEYKGDFARAYFYMATRYADVISTWDTDYATTYAPDVLDGTSDYVFDDWVITMLKSWHNADPVSQKELDRNEAAYLYQGNRNPFIDHPEYVEAIWGE